MADTESARGVIPAHKVKRVAQPALVDCTQQREDGKALAVVPLMESGRVAGLEVRCRCGASIVIECVYDQNTEHP